MSASHPAAADAMSGAASQSAANSSSGQDAAAMLEARNLFCERDERVLFEDLNFRLNAGELMQVQGSNGSGKTTLLRILCGLNDHYEGSIYWDGVPVEENRELFLASMLYIGHRVGVNKILSPRENLVWSSALHEPADKHSIDEALAMVGLAGYEDVPCHNLSAGQQQRVSLARLRLSPARLWVLDEPFTTLDVYGVKDLENLLARHTLAGGSVLVTTHHRLDVPCQLRRLNLDELGLGEKTRSEEEGAANG